MERREILFLLILGEGSMRTRLVPHRCVTWHSPVLHASTEEPEDHHRAHTHCYQRTTR